MENKKDWDAFGNVEEQANEAREEQLKEEKEIDKLFVRAFSSEDGKKVLQYFIKNTIEKPVYFPDIQPEQADGLSKFRSGQNSVIWEIQGRMERQYKGSFRKLQSEIE